MRWATCMFAGALAFLLASLGIAQASTPALAGPGEGVPTESPSLARIAFHSPVAEKCTPGGEICAHLFASNDANCDDAGQCNGFLHRVGGWMTAKQYAFVQVYYTFALPLGAGPCLAPVGSTCEAPVLVLGRNCSIPDTGAPCSWSREEVAPVCYRVTVEVQFVDISYGAAYLLLTTDCT